MALITLPAKFGLSRVKFGLRRGGVTLRSRFTGKRQTVVYPFAVWELEATLIDYPNGPEVKAIKAFLANLDGQKNTFQFPVPAWEASNNNVSVGNYTILNNAAAQAVAVNMQATGTDAGATPMLNIGDHFTVNNELKLVTSYTHIQGSPHQATIGFKPPLRKPVTAGMVVTVRNPYVVMHADEDDVATWGIAPPHRHDIKISAIEAIE